MSARGTADVVFVIDASASMGPCIDALRANIASFASSVCGSNAGSFDLRLEFVALKVDSKAGIYNALASRTGNAIDAIYNSGSPRHAGLLWSGPEEFLSGLDRIRVGADEDNLMALDMALDLPWRQASACHRVVLLLTDEPPEAGAMPADRRSKVTALIEKINDLRVKLFIVAPYSETLAELQAADGADYLQIQDDDVGKGLATVDFRKVMGAIAKSISVASLQTMPKPVSRALFGQDRMTDTDRPMDMHGSR